MNCRKIFILTILASMSILGVAGQTFTLDDYVYTVIADGEVELSSAPDNAYLIVPDNVEFEDIHYAVTRIGDYVFCSYSHPNAIKIFLGHNIREIGYNSFGGFPADELDFTSTLLEVIGDKAFVNAGSNSNGLKLLLPPTVKKLGVGCFNNCNAQSLKLYGKISCSDEGWLTGCKYLEDLDMSCCSLAELPEGFIAECPKLKKVIFPDNVISIKRQFVKSCRSLTTIDLSNTNVSRINATAFSDANCNIIKLPSDYSGAYGFVNLLSCRLIFADNNGTTTQSVKLSDCFISLDGTVVYRYAKAISEPQNSFTIPEGVKEIYYRAFMGNELLTEVILPDGLQKIGCEAFVDCKSLTSIRIPASCKEIGSMAFADCRALNEIYVCNSEPVEISYGQFYGVDRANGCVLYVPTNCTDKYLEAPGWSDFSDIREFDPADVNIILKDNMDGNCKTRYYDLRGYPVQNPEKGIYIKKIGKVSETVIEK